MTHYCALTIRPCNYPATKQLGTVISGWYRGSSPTAIHAWQPCPLW